MNYQGRPQDVQRPVSVPATDLTFENTGLQHSDIHTRQPWDIVLHDLYFYVIAFSESPFTAFAAAAALLFLFSRRKALHQWLLFSVAIFGCLLLIVWMPVNYFGGGGTLGNRYFLNIFPLFFFLLAGRSRFEGLVVASWGMAAVFLTSILASPFDAGRQPGEHATTGAFKWLPAELSPPPFPNNIRRPAEVRRGLQVISSTTTGAGAEVWGLFTSGCAEPVCGGMIEITQP
jgi:hypothetical protein